MEARSFGSRTNMKAMLLSVVVSTMAVACSSTQRFPSFGNIAESSSYELITSAPAPGGSGSSASYWLYGGQGEFSDLKQELAATFIKHNWRVFNPDASDAITFSDQQEQRCINFSDFRRTAQLHDYVLYDLARSGRNIAASHRTLVLVVASGCG